MTTTAAPRKSSIDDDRDLAQRVADLEVLFEEARRRARRRRIRNASAVAVGAAACLVGLIGFRGGGGGSAAESARAGGSGMNAQTTQPLSLAPQPAGNGAQAFAFDPRRPSVVYMAIAHANAGVFVYTTTDGGRHWLKTGAQGSGWTSDILTLTTDPLHPGTLYAGTDTAVYKTVNSGHTWRAFNHGLFPTNLGQRICNADQCSNRFVGTPGTPSWNRNNGYVLDVAVDPLHRNVVYAAAGAIHKSTDGGHTWRTVLAPPDQRFSTRIAVALTRPESIYTITHDNNGHTAIYKSMDAGRTWRTTGAGLPPSCCGDSEDSLVVEPGNPQTVYAAVGETVFVTTDGGATWQSRANGLPPNAVTSLSPDPSRPGVIYASVDIPHSSKTNSGDVEQPIGGIYRTTDGGQTWSELYGGLGIDKVAVNPARPSTIYAAGWSGRTANHPNRFRLLRSTDGGRNWVIAG
jgi:photosystem II stability/assembly factor-like uncharacterized protein